VAAVSTYRSVSSRLLMLDDPLTGSGDVREPGCCAVLGWYDEQNLLLQVRGWSWPGTWIQAECGALPSSPLASWLSAGPE